MGQRLALIKYHRDVGFPPDVHIPLGKHSLRWSVHAREAKFRYKENKKFACPELFLPKFVDIAFEDVVEITVLNDWRMTLKRLMIRQPYNKFNDICLAIGFSPKHGFEIVTAYLISNRGGHTSLNAARYCVPGKEKEYLESISQNSGTSGGAAVHPEGAGAGA